MIGQPGSWEPMTELAESVRTGRPAPILEEVGGLFAYLSRHPDQLAVFDEAMTAKAHADIDGILAAVDFSRYPTIADIGGGSGHLIRAIVDRHPRGARRPRRPPAGHRPSRTTRTSRVVREILRGPRSHRPTCRS